MSPAWFAAKSSIQISIDVPNRGESVVSALVWHVRRQKMHGGSRKVWAIGVILEDSDLAYQSLLAAVGVASQETDAALEAGRPHVGKPGASSVPGAPAAARPSRQSVSSSRSPASAPSPVPSACQAPSRPGSVGDGARRRPGAQPTSSAVPEADSTADSRHEDAEARSIDGLEPRIFRIRVKARSGPRTRVLSLAAESEDEARALAERDLDSIWTILEVRAA